MASRLNTLPKNKIPGSVLHLCIGLLMMPGNLSAQNFKQVNVSYKLNGKDASNTIYIPQYSGEIQPPVRGVMQNVGGPLKSFAHKSQVAMIARLDEGRGFSKALLAAAAKASNQPEIEFAGAQPPFSPMYSAQIRSSRPFRQKQIPSSQYDPSAKSKFLAASDLAGC